MPGIQPSLPSDSCRPGRVACLAIVALVVMCPVSAHGSFGGGGACRDFGCLFFMVGIVVGVVAVPVSALVFGVLHFVACHAERSRARQFLLGAGLGVLAYEVSALFAAMFGVSGVGVPAAPSHHMLIAFAAAYLALAACSVLYARSRPARLRPAGGLPLAKDS